MSILTRPLLHPQQRFDKEDWEVLLSSLRTDSKFYTRRFLSDENHIIQGFQIAQTYIGQSNVSITMEGATLINGPATEDFSWYTAEESPPLLVIPVGSSGLQPGRNFVELEVGSEQGTNLQRAFWDPSADGGSGIEFTNEVNTVVELTIGVEVNQVSFNTSNPNRIPLAIIDMDGSFIIQGIQDKREMFFRLGTPDDPTRDYPWASQTEPTTTLTFTAPSGTAFLADEIVSFTSGATATVVVGGTNNIEVFLFSNINYDPGDTVIGATSGANATLQSYYESFEGADKDLKTFRESFEAMMTEIKSLKGTNFWHEVGPVSSLITLLGLVNAKLVGKSAGARFEWTGTNLLITDDTTSGQATSDVLSHLRTFGDGFDLDITRQDGTGGSASIGIPDGYVLYIELPKPRANKTYSEAGAGTTNFIVVDRAAFLESDTNYILAYREGTKLFSAQFGEFEAGESKRIADETTKGTLAFIGAIDETDETPPYTTLPSPSLSNQFTTNDSLTQSISINAANINDLVAGLQNVYYEPLLTVSGAPSDSREVTGPISNGANLTLPLDSRDSDAAKEYLVGNGALMVFLNGQHLNLGEDYLEVGAAGTFSDEIQILQDIPINERIEFRILVPESFGSAGVPQPFFVNYITGQNGSLIPTGALYNSGTAKLGVYRNGLFMLDTLTVGDLIDRYTEPNNNSVLFAQSASPTEVTTFVNRIDPAPSTTLLTGVTGAVLTVPSYTVGSDRLLVYRNGLLLSTNVSAPTDLKMTESSSTTVTLDLAATISDVFTIYNAGVVPTWRESDTGLTGAALTIPNAQSYTMGDQHLLVFRNGVLMLNTLTLAGLADRYQEATTTTISLSESAVVGDFFEFLYI